MIYDHKITLADGKEFEMELLRGFVIIIINVANKCGYSKQNYADIIKLMDKYYNKGLRIILFPCNQFMNQEPDTNECILGRFESMDKRLIVSEKIDVNGEKTNLLYSYLKSKATGLLWTTSIKWNFTKFLINRDCSKVNRYSPSTNPMTFENDIIAFLESSKIKSNDV
eukprot:GHVP01047545.1.p1 GENE.GHVP01047545.1~~GHVP01047545.1.p1  ORF type:complete len:168 (+),score=16.29 GHVP01047545.1:569-1072(+)